MTQWTWENCQYETNCQFMIVMSTVDNPHFSVENYQRLLRRFWAERVDVSDFYLLTPNLAVPGPISMSFQQPEPLQDGLLLISVCQVSAITQISSKKRIFRKYKPKIRLLSRLTLKRLRVPDISRLE